jgi:hypothetical protein
MAVVVDKQQTLAAVVAAKLVRAKMVVFLLAVLMAKEVRLQLLYIMAIQDALQFHRLLTLDKAGSRLALLLEQLVAFNMVAVAAVILTVLEAAGLLFGVAVVAALAVEQQLAVHLYLAVMVVLDQMLVAALLVRSLPVAVAVQAAAQLPALALLVRSSSLSSRRKVKHGYHAQRIYWHQCDHRHCI